MKPKKIIRWGWAVNRESFEDFLNMDYVMRSKKKAKNDLKELRLDYKGQVTLVKITLETVRK